MSVQLFFKNVFGFSPLKSQVLDDQYFVIIDDPVTALSTAEQQQLIDKVKELFGNTIREVVTYTPADLASTGQLNGSGNLTPFTNYNADTPHTYASNIVKGEGEGTYHIRLASAIINESLGLEKDHSSLQVLRAQLKEGDPRRAKALQVAAVLHQVGDSLSPLPNDPTINATLIESKGFVTFDSQQKGLIYFSTLNPADRVIRFVVSQEFIDVKDLDGIKIGSFMGQRRISIHQPNRNGEIKCIIEREYVPHFLAANNGGVQ